MRPPAPRFINVTPDRHERIGQTVGHSPGGTTDRGERGTGGRYRALRTEPTVCASGTDFRQVQADRVRPIPNNLTYHGDIWRQNEVDKLITNIFALLAE